jgi:excisionase family DNA binding protein
MKLMTLRDVAVALRVSEKTVRRLVKRGDLPGFKVGGRGLVRIKQEDLDVYLEGQRVRLGRQVDEQPEAP